MSDGQSLGDVPGYGTFATADGGWIALGVLSEDGAWGNLVRALGLDDAASLGFAERVALGKQLNERIVKAIASSPRDEVVAALVEAGVPVAPVLSQQEMLGAELFRQRGTVADGREGEPVMGHPVRYERHSAQAPRDVPTLCRHRQSRVRRPLSGHPRRGTQLVTGRDSCTVHPSSAWLSQKMTARRW
jgi:crotonobetainyl-CoA:carnitine CoA-transferase CaiB-like acyl-CoA transferase